MLSVTTVGSVTDSDVLFQAANQNMWQRGSSDLIQYNLEWSACDESWDEGTVMRKSGKIGQKESGYLIHLDPGSQLDVGVYGGVVIDPGHVDVDYQADLGLEASDAVGIGPGDEFTINTSQNVDLAEMSTYFPRIEAYAGVFGDLDLSGWLQGSVERSPSPQTPHRRPTHARSRGINFPISKPLLDISMS